MFGSNRKYFTIIKKKGLIILEKEEFAKEFKKYVSDHPDMSKEDPDTYDLLVNEFMNRCHTLSDDAKNLFSYPFTANQGF